VSKSIPKQDHFGANGPPLSRIKSMRELETHGLECFVGLGGKPHSRLQINAIQMLASAVVLDGFLESDPAWQLQTESSALQ
jgi:hypothetical protein